MEHRHIAAEIGGKFPHHLRSQHDLRHQDDSSLALPQNLLHQTQIDLGLAAAGDAVEESHFPVRMSCQFHDCLKSGLLLFVQLDRRPRFVILHFRNTKFLFFRKGQDAGFLQPP